MVDYAYFFPFFLIYFFFFKGASSKHKITNLSIYLQAKTIMEVS